MSRDAPVKAVKQFEFGVDRLGDKQREGMLSAFGTEAQGIVIDGKYSILPSALIPPHFKQIVQISGSGYGIQRDAGVYILDLFADIKITQKNTAAFGTYQHINFHSRFGMGISRHNRKHTKQKNRKFLQRHKTSFD